MSPQCSVFAPEIQLKARKQFQITQKTKFHIYYLFTLNICLQCYYNFHSGVANCTFHENSPADRHSTKKYSLRTKNPYTQRVTGVNIKLSSHPKSVICIQPRIITDIGTNSIENFQNFSCKIHDIK